MLQQSGSVKSSRKSPQDHENIYDDGFLHIEYNNYFISCGGKTVKLSRVNFLILSMLAKSIGHYVPAETIWRQLWIDGKPFNTESFKVYLCSLRRQLAPFDIRIDTKINTGYCLVPSGH
jgi:DNA-binding response OmpR family regulator